MIEERKRIGREIKSSRLSKGISKEDLAEKLGVHVSTINKIERGAYSFGLDNINRVCKALGVKLTIKK